MTQSVLPANTMTDFPLFSDLVKVPFKFGPEVCPDEFKKIQSRLCFDYFKWDQQIGDVSTLFRQPLLAQSGTWNELKKISEDLSDELFSMEREILDRPELWTQLGIPRAIQNILKKAGRHGYTKSAARTLRFDFHYTIAGWRISEVNSDVPGGYAEASAFTAMMASQFAGTRSAGNPADMWADAMLEDAGNCRNVALLSAPGFLEDQQVTMLLAAILEGRGVRTHLLHHPEQLKWENGYASTIADNDPVALDAIVRFYQGEWLARLKKRAGWKWFFVGGKTPVANCGIAILTESKRLPLLFNFLITKTHRWQELIPECVDPREINWKGDEEWVFKASFSNTGDSVHLRELTSAKEWKKITHEARKFPEGWVAQRRFHAMPVDSNAGLVYPCIGVYTINGKAAGVYARASKKSVVDFTAMDIAFLIY